MYAPELNEAAQLVTGDPLARRVFRIIERSSSQSGWAIAKDLDTDPQTIEGTLKKLKELGILEAQGSGLEGYYYLTNLGFKLRELLLMRSAAG